MGKKYFTLSFDDGLEQDKRVIRLMKQYGLKGTFNLNAGLFGARGEVKGIGTFSFQDCPEGVKHKWPFSYVRHNRIPQDEVLQVYEGMEIATHGFRHESLGAVSENEMRASVDADKAALEGLFGAPIVGHAYAQGSTSPAVQAYLKERGYRYARAVFPSGGYEFPENPLNFRPSTSIILKDAMKLVERFKREEAQDRDLLLYLWAHSYEMDYEKGNASWDALERLFETIAGRSDIVYCTNSEAFSHI